jgi:hypothetical protein
MRATGSRGSLSNVRHNLRIYILSIHNRFPTVCGKRGIISWDSVDLSGSPIHSTDETLCPGVLAMEKNGCLVS